MLSSVIDTVIIKMNLINSVVFWISSNVFNQKFFTDANLIQTYNLIRRRSIFFNQEKRLIMKQINSYFSAIITTLSNTNFWY